MTASFLLTNIDGVIDHPRKQVPAENVPTPCPLNQNSQIAPPNGTQNNEIFLRFSHNRRPNCPAHFPLFSLITAPDGGDPGRMRRLLDSTVVAKNHAAGRLAAPRFRATQPPAQCLKALQQPGPRHIRPLVAFWLQPGPSAWSHSSLNRRELAA